MQLTPLLLITHSVTRGAHCPSYSPRKSRTIASGRGREKHRRTERDCPRVGERGRVGEGQAW